MGQSEKFSKMKLLIFLVAILLCSCAPVKESKESQTKYPDVPTMQSAEDAATGQLFKD